MSLNKNNRARRSNAEGHKRARLITLAVLGAMLVCCLAFCTACFSKDALPKPENLRINLDTMRFEWDEVTDSTGGYMIEIDEVEYLAPQTTFLANVLNFAPGRHQARVKALTIDHNYYTDSDWCDMYYFDVTIAQAGLSFRLINNGSEYEVASSGTMEFKDKNGNIIKDTLVIPDTYNGKKVTRIGELAFQYSFVYDVVLGDNITEIASSAFFGCRNLEKITLGKNITAIGSFAFFNSAALSEIEFPNGIIDIGESAFNNCTSLTEIVLPNSLKNLGKSVFENCTSLETITIGSGVTTIPQFGFYNCYALSEVILGGFEQLTEGGQPTFVSRLEYITRSSFKGCSSLMTLSIPKTVMTIENDTFTNAGFYTAALENKTEENNMKGDMLIYIDNWLIDINEEYLPTSAEIANETATYYDVVIDDETIAIANAALSGFTNMNSVDIPESVTKMGTAVFYGCIALNNVDFKAKVTEIPVRTFYECYALASITLHEGLKGIGQEAFSGCANLYEDGINFPDSLESIGQNAFISTGTYIETRNAFTQEGSLSDGVVYINDWLVTYIVSQKEVDTRTRIFVKEGTVGMADYAFSWFSSITSVSFTQPLSYMGRGAFSNCSSLTEFPDISGLSEIRPYTFNGCNTSLETLWNVIIIPEKITSIGEAAFRRMGVITMQLPSQITEIPNLAFSGSSLYQLNIPVGVTRIGDNAFASCNFLSTISIPESVTSIGSKAFAGCVSLVSVDLPSKITEISDGMFRDCIALTSIDMTGMVSIGNNAFRGCEALVTITLPDTVTSIGSHAFRDCSRLSSFTIPDSVKTIGTYVFAGCTEMRTINLGSGIDVVSVGMFQSCILLSNLVLPTNIKSIGDYAFTGCSNLRAINIGDNITGMGKHIFYEITNITVYTEASDSSKWDTDWNSSDRPVFWNCKLDAKKSYVVSFAKESEASIYNPSNFPINLPTRSGYTFYCWAESNDGGVTIGGKIRTSLAAEDGEYNLILYTFWR